MPLKIFISHAAVDEPLATALVDCLLSSMVLDDDEIRCTSVPGHKLPIGCDFTDALLTDLEDTAAVVGLVTRNSVSSGWVLFELGATWGARKTLRPLVTDEVDLKSLPGALSGRHVALLSKESDVAQFLDELATTVKAKRRSPSKIAKAVSVLLLAHGSHIAHKVPDSPMRSDSSPPNLPEAQIFILRALAAHSEEVDTSLVAQMAHVSIHTAAYHLEELRQKDYVSEVRYDGLPSAGIAPTSSWSLAHEGRAYLVKNNLIK